MLRIAYIDCNGVFLEVQFIQIILKITMENYDVWIKKKSKRE